MIEDNKLLDKPSNVREEDALDLDAVSRYVKEQQPEVKGELRLKQFLGGASNLTYQLDFDNATFILRCPPVGTKAKGAHNMEREFRIMKELKPVYPYVPKMIAFCNNPNLIGREFYLMEKLNGIIPRANLPRELSLSRQQTRLLCTNVLDKLIELHQVDIQPTGLKELSKGSGYASRQIEGWSERYKKARTWNVSSCSYVMSWLKDHLPEEERSCFIHNDFRFDNVVLTPEDPVRVIGVLDWEMATVGDPLMDLGNSLAYWVQADDDFLMKQVRRQPTHLPGMLSRKEAVAYYSEKTGFQIKDFTFYEVYGLFRLAVIAQQIYYRYHHKQTSNPAYKHFWILVNYLNWRCKRAIKGRT
ncbi:phosphotransferase family protein [Nafulsella turpanensis]|uniref:phosphotransferase family protein n=1 Tax=Nafulsella turpanensis TaxID=1265690 RepID=UPI0003495014|nr:phosphotransferase family protein [Nafulsella turpanensis]